MFTGIVEHVGRLVTFERSPDLAQIRVDLGPIAEGVSLGDSISVSGCCLTVTGIEDCIFSFDMIRETLETTRLGNLIAGQGLNLERAMSAGARFDGHIVQGHVDATGKVLRLDREGNEVELHIECHEDLAAQLVDKGSVTIDGVSLTVVRVVPNGFHVALIPHTLEVTTLSSLSPGDEVNLEADVFGKYVKQYLDRVLPGVLAGGQHERVDEAK